jgi:hypothetical protein
MSSYLKTEAISRVDKLHQENRIDFGDYSAIYDGLTEIETLRDRDESLEELWAQLGDIPLDPDGEHLLEPFMGWGKGTSKEEIWHWFDRRHSKGIGHLLYSDGIDRTEGLTKLVYLKRLCIECESRTCQFNHSGECRFAMVHERKPRINDIDGCIDYDYQEGEE